MLLEVQNLQITYGDFQSVYGVSFVVRKGELVSIIGANGAGKTSILKAVMGLVKPIGGNIYFNGEEITHQPVYQRARSGIRLVAERGTLFPYLSVYENLLTGLYRIRKEAKVSKRLAWLFELFPVLRERKNQQASTLSGGEQQQLSIARALVADPQILLVDEISMGLMPQLVYVVFQVLAQLNKESGLTVLLVEQNALESLQISNRAYVLESGRVVFHGNGAELMADERVRQAYIGV